MPRTVLSTISRLANRFRRPVEQPAVAEETAVIEGTSDVGAPDAYQERLNQELAQFKEVGDVHALPAIFDYWAKKYIIPMFEECGFSGVDEFLSKYMLAAAHAIPDRSPKFVSIGSGNCDTEVRLAKLLKESGLTEFSVECLELNPHMIARGREMADSEGVSEHMIFTAGDFNNWNPNGPYASVIANHSLHHVVNLEGLFDSIKSSLEPTGNFIVNDVIGRNGHQRWPEALEIVERLWQELPDPYRYHRILNRHDADFVNWDCSSEGFEGIRAQDILPLLIERFDFPVFIGFGNVIIPFVDRGFGHNFDATAAWDQEFIDNIHAIDEAGFKDGSLKPTQMLAVMTPVSVESHSFARGISPAASVRVPS